MGFLNFFTGANINEGVKKYNETPGAYLIDVREPGEYSQGHIPGSKNVPLSKVHIVGNFVKDKNTPVFVYCLSGGRSSQAANKLKSMGFTDVNNIGGINSYKGAVER